MKTYKQAGFTFLELMLSITFIGIAAAGTLGLYNKMSDYPANSEMNKMHTQIISLIQQSYGSNPYTGLDTLSIKGAVIPSEYVRGNTSSNAYVKTPYRASQGVYAAVASDPNKFTATYTGFPQSSCGAFISDSQSDAVTVSIGGVNVKDLPGTPFTMTLLNTNCTLSSSTSDSIGTLVFTYQN
jgi:type II secretory pathway pseudopilin PulG